MFKCFRVVGDVKEGEDILIRMTFTPLVHKSKRPNVNLYLRSTLIVYDPFANETSHEDYPSPEHPKVFSLEFGWFT